MDNFDKYHEMRCEGKSAQEVYLAAKSDGLDKIACIRLLRQVFELSLTDAKEVMIIAETWGTSLDDYQEKLLPGLKRAFEESEDE